MKTLCVLQHTEAEFLGLIEDHFEARAIGFQYVRPFAGASVPREAGGFDGLVVLGAGPFGVVSGPLVPSLAAEYRLAANFLKRGRPVIGIGVGACVLAIAAGGGAAEAPLHFRVGEAHRSVAEALYGHIPERFPIAVYMRDCPVVPRDARVLAIDEGGAPAIFQIGESCLGFLGHPGMKSAMAEDLAMAFDEAPENMAEGLDELRAAQSAIAAALGEIMVGVMKSTRLMAPC